MSGVTKSNSTAAQRYDSALLKGRFYRLLPGTILPQPTSAWPPENVVLLESYRDWLLSSGSSEHVVSLLYIPMAGHALGLNLKPHPQLDIDADVGKALDFLKAKRLSAEWTDMCRCALDKFRQFLRQERGQLGLTFREPSHERYSANLPSWLVVQLERYQHIRQRNWRQARLAQQSLNFWSSYTRFWRWLCARQTINSLADVKRQHILDFVDHQLTIGLSPTTVNGDIRYIRAFLLFLREQDFEVPLALLRLPSLKEADSLPKFLTDEQVKMLRNDLENRVLSARFPVQRRDALLDRAVFYLLWQGAMRRAEVEEICLEDLDLTGRKLTVRQGKGLKDRTVFLTDSAVSALQGYLAVRGRGADSHVFLYRNLPMHKDLIWSRVRAVGERTGVKVTPHRLRHTCATQLLNAGCKVTSIQKFLGHQKLNSTMIYAWVCDKTVANDYYIAMEQIEKSLELAPKALVDDQPISANERELLLDFVSRLTAPDLDLELRLTLTEQMRLVLCPSLPQQLKAVPGLEHSPADVPT